VQLVDDREPPEESPRSSSGGGGGGQRNRRRATRVRRRQLSDIGGSLSVEACTGVLNKDLARATQSIGAEIHDALSEEHEHEMFTGLISALIGVILQPFTENSMSRGGNLIVQTAIDLLCLSLALPICVGLAHALVHSTANMISVLLAEALHYQLTTLLLDGITKEVVPELEAMLGNTILRWMRVEMVPIASLEVSNFVIGTLPNALAEAVSEAVSKAITPTLTMALTKPVMNYYYCLYCYYYGDYCQYCFYNRDMQWIGQKWWLGGEQGGVDS